jgi:hypothetical protein
MIQKLDIVSHATELFIKLYPIELERKDTLLERNFQQVTFSAERKCKYARERN